MSFKNQEPANISHNIRYYFEYHTEVIVHRNS